MLGVAGNVAFHGLLAEGLVGESLLFGTEFVLECLLDVALLECFLDGHRHVESFGHALPFGKQRVVSACHESDFRVALVDYFAEVYGEPVEEGAREELTDVLETISKPEVSDDEVLKAFLKAL